MGLIVKGRLVLKGCQWMSDDYVWYPVSSFVIDLKEVRLITISEGMF